MDGVGTKCVPIIALNDKKVNRSLLSVKYANFVLLQNQYWPKINLFSFKLILAKINFIKLIMPKLIFFTAKRNILNRKI
jgi:hypothetical protein